MYNILQCLNTLKERGISRFYGFVLLKRKVALFPLSWGYVLYLPLTHTQWRGKLWVCNIQGEKTQWPLLSCHGLQDIISLEFVLCRPELILNHGKLWILKSSRKMREELILDQLGPWYMFIRLTGRKHVIGYGWCLMFWFIMGVCFHFF